MKQYFDKISGQLGGIKLILVGMWLTEKTSQPLIAWIGWLMIGLGLIS